MLKQVIIVTFFVTMSIGCSQSGDGETFAANQSFASKAEADNASPVKHSCEKRDGEIVRHFPAYIRGDVDSDGRITLDDARRVLNREFDPRRIKCPATSDVVGANLEGGPDGYFSYFDRRTFARFLETKQVQWRDDLICGFNCEIRREEQQELPR